MNKVTSDQLPVTKYRKNHEVLRDRITSFSKNCLNFSRKIPDNTLNHNLIIQFVKASSSVGANYQEADEAETKRDFIHIFKICKKEAKESEFWLILIVEINSNLKEEARILYKEADELVRIFATIVRNTESKISNLVTGH